jgi:RNA polymerase primary sigma factor
LFNQWYAALRSALRGYRIARLGDGHRGNLQQVDVLVAIVHTARKYEHLPTGQRGLLVADECHRYGADTFRLVLDQAFPRRLGLTATYERSDGGHLAYLAPYFGGPPIFSLDYQRAIADGVAAHFKLALIGVPLTPSEQQRYLEADEALRDARARLIHQGVPAEPYGEFMRAVAELAEAPSWQLRTAARRYLAAFSNRRQVLSESNGKLLLLARLGDAINAATGSLIFTMTTRSADRIAATLRQQGIPSKALHSGLGSNQRNDLLRRFAEQRLKALVAPMVLDEGVDVPEADLAIVVAASRTRRQMIQRMGRVLRNKADGRLARIAIVYAAKSFEDPQQGAHEAFLDSVQEAADDCRDFRPGAPSQLVVDYLRDHRPVPTTGHRIVVDYAAGWRASCSCGWSQAHAFRKKRDALRSAEPHLKQTG